MSLRSLSIIAILSCIIRKTPATPIFSSPSEPSGNSTNEAQCSPKGVSLNFRNVGLRRIDASFAGSSSPSVLCLNLDDNELEHVSSSAFESFPNLERLSLARNKLSPAALSQLAAHKHLRALILDANSDEANNSATLQFDNKFPSLSYLYVRECGIRDVKSLGFAPKLTHLYASSNDLSGSKLSFLDRETLEYLDLSNASISSLDTSKLNSLEELMLDDNRFERVCGSRSCQQGALVLEGAQALRRVSVARNRLTGIEPDAFDDAGEALEELDLSANQIDAIRKNTFEATKALKNLSLRDNRLTEMPDLCGPESLLYLSLAGNKIEALRVGSFCLIRQLKVLDLSGNRIRSVEDNALAGLKELESVDLSGNAIKSLPSAWINGLPKLRVLSAKDNRLGSLADVGLESVRPRSALQYVYLQNNLIATFHTSQLFNVFKLVPNITIVFVDQEGGRRVKSLNGTAVGNENGDKCKCDCDEDNEVF